MHLLFCAHMIIFLGVLNLDLRLHLWIQIRSITLFSSCQKWCEWQSTLMDWSSSAIHIPTPPVLRDLSEAGWSKNDIFLWPTEVHFVQGHWMRNLIKGFLQILQSGGYLLDCNDELGLAGRYFLKPYWLSFRMLCLSKWAITLLWMMCSNSCQVMAIRDTGLCLSPFLNTGTIQAFFIPLVLPHYPVMSGMSHSWSTAAFKYEFRYGVRSCCLERLQAFEQFMEPLPVWHIWVWTWSLVRHGTSILFCENRFTLFGIFALLGLCHSWGINLPSPDASWRALLI